MASLIFLNGFSIFAYDFMGDLTYSKRCGFLESGKDVNGIISYVQSFGDCSSRLVSPFP